MFFSLRGFWNSSSHFRGAFWKIFSFLCFSAINGIVRYLFQESESIGLSPLPAYEVALFQNLFGLLFLAPWLLQREALSLKSHLPALQLLRVLLAAAGVVLWYVTLTYMPLARAVALMFLGPLITALGARFLLGEKIGQERALAIVVGFLGGWLLSEPTFDAEGFTVILLLPFLAAACLSGATLVIRRLAAVDTPQLTTAYLLLFMTPLLAVPTLFYGIVPESWQWPWLFIMGALAAAAHLSLTKAYNAAEVSYLIPYGMTKWGASALIGLCAFGEVPSVTTCIGAFILMSAIVGLSYGDVRSRGRVAKENPPFLSETFKEAD